MTTFGDSLHTIAYVSTTETVLSDEQLAALLVRARGRNDSVGVTGVLLYRNGQFAQILEGPEGAIRAVFAEIERDTRHTGVRVVADNPIAARQFATWTMGYRPLNEALIDDVFGAEEYNLEYDEARPFGEPTLEQLFDELQSAPKTDADAVPRIKHAHQTASQALDFTHIGSSKIVAGIFDAIMADVHSGALLPGDRMSDEILARRMGTSRTPVREALQLLRSIGVVEVAANRFTRIAVVDADHAAELIVVFVALYGAVLDEVVPRITEDTLDLLRQDYARFAEVRALGDSGKIVSSATAFFLRLVEDSHNSALQRSINSVVHTLLLAGPHVEEQIGFDTVDAVQQAILSAATVGDLNAARSALASLIVDRSALVT